MELLLGGAESQAVYCRVMSRRNRWLLPLVGVAALGSFALLVVSRLPRSADPVAGAEPGPVTVETLTQEAEEIVARLVEAYPQDAESHALMGTVRQLHGRTSEAERSWERSLELDPTRAEIHDALAKASWERGEFERAAAACREALQVDPTMHRARIRLGRSLLELGQVEEAVAALEQAVSSTGRGHYYLAQAYMQLQAYGRARDSYRRAVDLNPDNARAYYGLAMASIRLGEHEQARQYQEAFRKLGVEDPEAVKARKRADGELSGLTQGRSMTANACTGAARIHRRHGDLKEAERLWQRAAALDPSNYVSREELLALYEQAGRLEDGRRFFEQLADSGSGPHDYFLLARIWTKLGDRAAALTALESCLTMDPGKVPCQRLDDELRKAG
jgi:tetratricopeptide (TPR) repeat protein